jgi:xanthine dehydrogenase accessory factor
MRIREQAEPAMNPSGASLEEFFRHHASLAEPLVLATIVRTIGSTYRKAGAQMLIAADGSVAGLLSGGCLEADLAERAQAVLGTGRACIVDYDSRSSEDILWGMGLGCEGAMSILLLRIDHAGGYEPYAFQDRCRTHDRLGRIALVIASDNPGVVLGQAYRSDDLLAAPETIRSALATEKASRDKAADVFSVETQGVTFLVIPVASPVRLLVLGAGPDVMPLAEIAGLLGWHVTIFDHRPAYAIPQRFPRARRVASNAAHTLPDELRSARYDAAVVMSHHLLSDEIYLSALAESSVPYIGLLGPAPRRVRLMHEIGSKASNLDGRLYGPVGLDIGASTPETIALAIVAEIQAVMSGRSAGSFRERAADSVGKRV